MKKLITSLTAATVLSLAAGAAMAETTFEEVWTCKLEEGKTVEDVQVINSRWLKFVNDKAGKGKIRSSVVMAQVGNIDMFLFVDTYPDLATWAATKEALRSEEGQALDEAFEGVSDCSENRLYRREYTE